MHPLPYTGFPGLKFAAFENPGFDPSIFPHLVLLVQRLHGDLARSGGERVLGVVHHAPVVVADAIGGAEVIDRSIENRLINLISCLPVRVRHLLELCDVSCNFSCILRT